MSVNKVFLIGNVGKDPESFDTEKGLTISKFSMATSFKKADGEEITHWHNIVSFDKLAGIVKQYVKKGNKLGVFGEIRYSKYEKDGVMMRHTEIFAKEIELLSIKPKQSDSGEVPF